MMPIPYALTPRAYEELDELEELARRALCGSDVAVDCPIPYALTPRAYEELALFSRGSDTEEL